MKKIISESGFARINRILQGDARGVNTYGIVTGENPCGCELDSKDNNEMNQRLVSIIRGKGYGFHKVGGNFFNNEEKSFLIPNITKDELIELGKKLKQYSVIFGVKNVTEEGRVFMKHNMLRTYCDKPCKKTRNWDDLSLNRKLRWLKPLKKVDIGSVESERSVSLSGKDTQSKITNYSHIKSGNRRFSIPFYDDPKSNAYPSTEDGRSIVPYNYDLVDGYEEDDLDIEDKYAFIDLDNSEEFEEYVPTEITENDITRITKKVIKEQNDGVDVDKAVNKILPLIKKGDDGSVRVAIRLLQNLKKQEIIDTLFIKLGIEPVNVNDKDGIKKSIEHITTNYLDLSGEQMDTLPDLSNYNNLTEIDAIGCGLNTLPPVEHLPQSLRYLGLNDNDITEIDMEGYRNLPNLEVLLLKDNPIQWVNWQEVSELPVLIRLTGAGGADNFDEMPDYGDGQMID